MGILDRFRRKTSPPKRRGYAGVNTSRLFADFSTMTRSSDAELKPALRVLRNRCRELSRNDEYVRRYLGLLKTNVVGPYGVNVQAKARNADGSLDAPGNKIVENAWKAWGQRGNCTVDGRLSWVDAQRLFVETLARDGEAIIRFIYNFNNIDSLAIEFVEADILDEELNWQVGMPVLAQSVSMPQMKKGGINNQGCGRGNNRNSASPKRAVSTHRRKARR